MLKYYEHFDSTIEEEIELGEKPIEIVFAKKREDCQCIYLCKKEERNYLKLSYFIGVDHIPNTNHTIYVEPKLNKDSNQTNYLEMLFSALKHPEVSEYTDELFEIKWDQPYIEIEQNQDHLTPLLVVQFLRIVQRIVRKGLKKSYYKVEQNLNSRVKGKILIGQTIKQNQLKNKQLYTYCSFDEFGINNLENRLLKKALVFVQRYMPTLKISQSEKYTNEMLSYIMPAFESVSEDVSLHDIKHAKYNAFYKEYKQGIFLARLILKKFGYNISNTEKTAISTPPFWIDMSKLFELYVLGLLKDKFGSEVIYHFTTNYQELDYLIKNETQSWVIDAKYKPIYQTGGYDIENIRQISAYARLKKVYEKLSLPKTTLIDCLIIYPEALTGFNKFEFNFDKKEKISEFVGFYKIGVELPTIKQKQT